MRLRNTILFSDSMRIELKKSIIGALIESAKQSYPNETLLLLVGKIKKGESINVDEIMLAPFTTYGAGYAFFSPYHLPIGLNIVGIAHSHPNGNPTPSLTDLNNNYGVLLLLTAYPYNEDEVRLYNRNGEVLKYELVD